jgi:hypothetical protein
VNKPIPLDLDALRAAAEAATQGEGQHIYTHPRDDNNWKANEDWHRVCEPAVILALIDRLRKAEAAREGWKWVPVEPTPVMISEAWRALIGNADYAKIRSAWDVMLAAAPDNTPTDSADSEGAKG